MWRDTTLTVQFGAGDRFSVSRFIRPGQGSNGWYVDFVRPARRTPLGIDTFDLLLDLVVTADLSEYRWKDEDEYAHGCRLGLIDDALHRRVDAAGEQVVALIESPRGPSPPTGHRGSATRPGQTPCPPASALIT